jgi:hypothetical protein
MIDSLEMSPFKGLCFVVKQFYPINKGISSVFLLHTSQITLV